MKILYIWVLVADYIFVNHQHWHLIIVRRRGSIIWSMVWAMPSSSPSLTITQPTIDQQKHFNQNHNHFHYQQHYKKSYGNCIGLHFAVLSEVVFAVFAAWAEEVKEEVGNEGASPPTLPLSPAPASYTQAHAHHVCHARRVWRYADGCIGTERGTWTLRLMRTHAIHAIYVRHGQQTSGAQKHTQN